MEQGKRLRYQVYMPKDKCSSLGAHILCGELKKRVGLKTANIGTEELANDLSAKIVTLAHISNAAAIESFTTEVLVLSPTEILIDTARSQKEWESHISALRRIGQLPPIKEVRWRQSKSGRVWAKPKGLKAGLSIRRPGRPIPGRIFLTVQGTGGNITHEHLQEVMVHRRRSSGKCYRPY